MDYKLPLDEPSIPETKRKLRGEYNRIERILTKKGEDKILKSYGKTPTLFLKMAFEMAMENLSVRQKESFKNVAKKLFPKVRIK